MESLLKAIEQTLGPVMLKVAVVLFGLYVFGESFFKLGLSIRGFSSRRRRLERERSLLEVLKLRCDIEALKKAHGLDHIELPALDPLDFEPRAKQAGAPLARLFAEFLSKRGWLGTVLLGILVFVFQFLSLIALALSGAGVWDLVERGSLSREEGTIMVVALVVSVTAGYLGFFVIRRRLVSREPNISLAATILAVASVLSLIIAFIRFLTMNK